MLQAPRSPTVGYVLGGTQRRVRVVACLLATALLIPTAACSSSPANESSTRYAEDCEVVFTEFTTQTASLTDAVADLEPIGIRRLQSPVVETPEGDKIRKLQALSRSERAEWESEAIQLLFQRLEIAFARAWPAAQDEDLRGVLRDLAGGDNFDTNFASLAVMCPGIDKQLETVTAEFSTLIETRSQAIEEPANL